MNFDKSAIGLISRDKEMYCKKPMDEMHLPFHLLARQGSVVCYRIRLSLNYKLCLNTSFLGAHVFRVRAGADADRMMF